LQWRKLRAESPRQGESRAARHAPTHPVPSGRSHPLVSHPARWAGLTNRAPVVRRTPFAERTATLSASRGLNSEAPQPGAFAHSIQRRAEGKPPKALLGARRSRADGPAFLRPARPSLQAGVNPLVSYPTRWAGLTNRAPVVRRTPFAERTATLSTSKGLNSAAPQPAAFAHSIQRKAEGKFPKALPEAGRSRADGPGFLSPARKGWVLAVAEAAG